MSSSSHEAPDRQLKASVIPPESGPTAPNLVYFAGHHGEAPIPLTVFEPPPPADIEALEKEGADAALAWLQTYRGIPDRNRPGRTEFLLNELHQFGGSVRVHLAKNLRAGVSLELLLRDSLYKDIVDASGQPRYTSESQFITDFLKMYNISDARPDVSKLRRAAALWLNIVDAQLPFPPVLSRLYRLIGMDTPEIALFLYGTLVDAAGGKVPSLAAIVAAVDAWEMEDPDQEQDGRGWKELVRDEIKIACIFLSPENLKPMIARDRLTKATAILDKHSSKKKEKGKKEEAKPPPTGAPPRPCPIKLECSAVSLFLDASAADPEVARLIARMAPGLKWIAQGNDTWVLPLPQRPPRAFAKKHQIYEWITRLLEKKGYEPPAPLPDQRLVR